LRRRQPQRRHLDEFAPNAMQQGRDALIVMMLRDWGFDSRHDLAE
jgi:hypothetical protein